MVSGSDRFLILGKLNTPQLKLSLQLGNRRERATSEKTITEYNLAPRPLPVRPRIDLCIIHI